MEHIQGHFKKYSSLNLIFRFFIDHNALSPMKCTAFLAHPNSYESDDFYIYSTLNLQRVCK